MKIYSKLNKLCYYLQALLLAGSIAISAVWLVFRKEDWAWMLQDILGNYDFIQDSFIK